MILKPKTLKGNSFMRCSLFCIWCVTVGSLLDQEELGSGCEGSWVSLLWNLSDIRSPVSSVFSGVWLASVSQWAKNQRAFLEAGAAGHPGPTVPEPVGLEPRVQRGSTTLSESSQRCFPSFLSTGRPVVDGVMSVTPGLSKETKWVSETKRARMAHRAWRKRFCFFISCFV